MLRACLNGLLTTLPAAPDWLQLSERLSAAGLLYAAGCVRACRRMSVCVYSGESEY